MYNPFEKKKVINNPPKFQNEFESFKKRLGKNLLWFISLDSKKQWDLMFMWKTYKWKCIKRNETPSLRNFIYQKKSKGKFFVSKQKLRETTINQLIK
jgi:hypothetical protein